MAGEQFYYTNNSFAYHIDDDGRIVDNINNQVIGICTHKKNELVQDYKAVCAENSELKARLENIENLLEKHQKALPEELQLLVQKPPSIESLSSEISELKNIVAQMALMMNEGVRANDNKAAMPESRTESENTRRSRSKTEVIGDKSE